VQRRESGDERGRRGGPGGIDHRPIVSPPAERAARRANVLHAASDTGDHLPDTPTGSTLLARTT
jgi:hypothetical protein